MFLFESEKIELKNLDLFKFLNGIKSRDIQNDLLNFNLFYQWHATPKHLEHLTQNTFFPKRILSVIIPLTSFFYINSELSTNNTFFLLLFPSFFVVFSPHVPIFF